MRSLYERKSLSSASDKNSNFVMPMPCSPEITPFNERAKAMMRATAT